MKRTLPEGKDYRIVGAFMFFLAFVVFYHWQHGGLELIPLFAVFGMIVGIDVYLEGIKRDIMFSLKRKNGEETKRPPSTRP